MKILLIDNFDSFTYNLVHYLEIAGAEVFTIRNNQIPFDSIRAKEYQGVVISPGPKRPEDAGRLMELFVQVPEDLPILGICLGMQAIGLHFGMTLDKAPLPMHGKTSELFHCGKGLFHNLPTPTTVMRYHSLVLLPPLAAVLEVTASTQDGLIMAFKHQTHPIEGVQFHPESIGTHLGQIMITSWIDSISNPS